MNMTPAKLKKLLLAIDELTDSAFEDCSDESLFSVDYEKLKRLESLANKLRLEIKG